MKPAIKGMLLSGLVFPGLGQVVLGRRKRGAALMLLALGCLVAIVTLATRMSLAILAKIEAEGGTIDSETIVATAAQATTDSGALAINVLFGVLAACWVAGIVDAARAGDAPDVRPAETRP